MHREPLEMQWKCLTTLPRDVRRSTYYEFVRARALVEFMSVITHRRETYDDANSFAPVVPRNASARLRSLEGFRANATGLRHVHASTTIPRRASSTGPPPSSRPSLNNIGRDVEHVAFASSTFQRRH